MKNKVVELLRIQKEARNVLAVEIIDEAKTLLTDLGCEGLLTTTTGETIIKEVEVVKEIEIVKEVEVPVEIVKEVPVEIIKEVEVIKTVSSDKDKKTIKELNKELKKVNKALEYNKGVNITLREKIKELKKATPAIKEVEVPVVDTEAMAAAAKEHSKIVMQLNNQIAAKDSIIEALNQRIQELEAAGKTNKESNARVHTEEPTKDNVEGLHIIKNYDSHVIGRYNGVAFEAMKNIEGTNVYDPTKWNMKDTINQVLVDAGYIAPNRNIKDNYRVECETGSCHEISDKKYMGYVVVDGVAYSYVFNTAYANGYPCCVELDKYLANPAQVKRNACGKKAIITAINSLIEMRNAKVEELQESSDDILKALGCSASDNDDATDNSSRLAQTNDETKNTAKDKEPENVEPEVPDTDGFDFGALDFSDTPVPEQEEEEDTIDGNPRSWYFADDSDNELW